MKCQRGSTLSRDSRVIDAVWRECSLEERVAALICAVVERRPQAMKALVSTAAVLDVMARHVPAGNRIAFAELLRDVADHVEQGRAPARVE